jgi:hypothetical protein
VTIFLSHLGRIPHFSLGCSLSIASHYVSPRAKGLPDVRNGQIFFFGKVYCAHWPQIAVCSARSAARGSPTRIRVGNNFGSECRNDGFAQFLACRGGVPGCPGLIFLTFGVGELFFHRFCSKMMFLRGGVTRNFGDFLVFFEKKK